MMPASTPMRRQPRIQKKPKYIGRNTSTEASVAHQFTAGNFGMKAGNSSISR